MRPLKGSFCIGVWILIFTHTLYAVIDLVAQHERAHPTRHYPFRRFKTGIYTDTFWGLFKAVDVQIYKIALLYGAIRDVFPLRMIEADILYHLIRILLSDRGGQGISLRKRAEGKSWEDKGLFKTHSRTGAPIPG